MFQALFTIFAPIVLSIAALVGVYNYVPLEKLELSERVQKLGATITTIAGSDTISSSRTTINDNFTNLNNGKVENATTSMSSVTTLANLVTVGTITSGTWNGSVIDVARQGTGTTSPSIYRVILGNGASGLTVASGTGSTGQLFASNGPGAYPSWQSITGDQTANYNWTGRHGFGSSTPPARVGVQGDVFVSGTTTAGILVATSTITANGIGTSTIGGNLNILGVCTGCAPAVQSYIPRLPAGATTTSISLNSGGANPMNASQFEIPFRQTFQKISYNAVAIGSDTGMDVKIFGEDGTTVVLATTTGAAAVLGVNTITASSTFTLAPGIYWIAFEPHPPGLIEPSTWNFSPAAFTNLNNVSGEPRIICQYPRAANQFKMPGVIDTTGCSVTESVPLFGGLIFRLDT